MNPSIAEVPYMSGSAVGTSRALAKLFQLIAAGGSLDGLSCIHLFSAFGNFIIISFEQEILATRTLFSTNFYYLLFQWDSNCFLTKFLNLITLGLKHIPVFFEFWNTLYVSFRMTSSRTSSSKVSLKICREQGQNTSKNDGILDCGFIVIKA